MRWPGWVQLSSESNIARPPLRLTSSETLASLRLIACWRHQCQVCWSYKYVCIVGVVLWVVLQRRIVRSCNAPWALTHQETGHVRGYQMWALMAVAGCASTPGAEEAAPVRREGQRPWRALALSACYKQGRVNSAPGGSPARGRARSAVAEPNRSKRWRSLPAPGELARRLPSSRAGSNRKARVIEGEGRIQRALPARKSPGFWHSACRARRAGCAICIPAQAGRVA